MSGFAGGFNESGSILIHGVVSFSAPSFSRGTKKLSGQTLAGSRECILGGTGRDSGERSEQTHGAESRLGEPRKQNGGERSARLAFKRGCAREKEEAEKDRIPSS